MSLIGLVVLGLAVSACTGSSKPDETGAAASLASNLVQDPDGAEAGSYFIKTDSAGVEPFLGLVRPAPVGTIELYRVTVGRHDASGLSETVTSGATVEVKSSLANGDGSNLSYVLDEPTSDDLVLANDLAPLAGEGANFWLDENRVGVSRRVSTVPNDVPSLAVGLAMDLLEAPLTLSMPIPIIDLGAGATWSGETRSLDGFVVHFDGVILENSSLGYELRLDLVSGPSNEPDLTGVLTIRGQPGTALPAFSSLTLDLPNGSGSILTMECVEGC